MKIKKLTIKGFRGFNEIQSISLDNDIVIIYGLNGSGKSSFTEALEWLFFGEISRQRLSRCKSEYQYEEYLKNLFYASADNPFVEVEGDIKGKHVLIKKELTTNGEKFFIDGKDVINFNSLNLNLENYFRPMLAQTEIKALIETGQQDRWEQLSSILGQDDLTKLRENLMTLKTKKRDDSYKSQEIKWNAIKDDILTMSFPASFTESIENLDSKKMLSAIMAISQVEAESFKDLSEGIKIKQKSLLNTELGKRVAEIIYKDENELKVFLSEILEHFNKLEEEAIKSTSEGLDHNYLDFLRTGKDYAKLPDCPFCLEKSLTVERLEKINKTLEEGKEAYESKSKFVQHKNKIESWITSFKAYIKDYFPSQQELKIISQKFSDIEESELTSLIQEFNKKIDEIINNLNEELINISRTQFNYIEFTYFHEQKIGNNIIKIKEFISESIFKKESIILEWELLKNKIAEKLPLSGQISQEEIKKWLILEKICNFFERAETFTKQYILLQRIDKIREKLEQYEKIEVSRLLNEHAQEIKKYYEKLNPKDKFQFSGIEVKGGARRQAKLKAEAFGKDINPITIFSEAHTNSLALSIYFPQRVDRNSTWETVILDDPVQSMDENHSQALIEILANIKKQVIVLTHSKLFFRRLCARFGHKRPIVYLFYYNEDAGPSIKLDEGETLSHLKIAEEGCSKGDRYSLETASEQLRKAIESVCLDFLLEKGVGFNKAHKIQKSGLDSLFSETEKLGLSEDEIGKLKSLLDTSNGDSHAWSIVDTTQGGINTGIKYIRNICDSFIK